MGKPRVRDRNRMAETHAAGIGSVRSMIARPEGRRHKKATPREGAAVVSWTFYVGSRMERGRAVRAGWTDRA